MHFFRSIDRGHFISNERCDFGEGQEICRLEDGSVNIFCQQNALKFLQTFQLSSVYLIDFPKLSHESET